MKTLVTGGAGFIGSNLAATLASQGHEVLVLDNLSSGFASNVPSGARFVEGDVRDPSAVARVMAGVEVVFHLAASVGNKRSIDLPLVDSEINVLGTLTVLEAARKEGVRKIVSSSSAGIYGELRTVPISEDHPAEPDTPYGASKLCQEKQCLAYAKLYDIEAVCLRYFNVYGPHQRFDAYGNVIPIFVFQTLRAQPLTVFGDGDQTRDFINVHDVVQANIKAASAAGVSGAFNVGSGERISINNLLREIVSISGLAPAVTHSPPRPGDVRHSLADISAAKNAFGFAPSVPIREGLSGYLAWAKQELESSSPLHSNRPR